MRIKKAIPLIIMAILLTSSFIPTSHASYQRWKEIEKWMREINASATLVKLEFTSTYKNRYLSEDQFELYENVIYIRLYMIDSTSNISIDGLLVISPSGYEKYIDMKEINYKKPILYISNPFQLSPQKPLIFNETGIWTIEILTNSSTSICECKGNNKVINYYGNRKGIEVLSPSAVQQLATAIETKNLVKLQKWMVIWTAIMAGFTAIMVFLTAIDIIKRRKEKD